MSVRDFTQDDLHWLACPLCHGSLHLDLLAAVVQCETCRCTYRVKDRIPVLILSA
ncbi:Trm112 family protein [Granulicella arctica]|uniref:Trm112 family protein n=1 Tax=Granulicella arctica TaxID=940613 RepID=UPI0037C06B93